MGEGFQEKNEEGARLQSLKLVNFRNFHTFTCPHFEDMVLFHGPNAVGKTSTIEAIQLVCAMKSFRSSAAPQFVRWGENQMRVDAGFIDGKRRFNIRLDVFDGKKTYSFNDKRKKAASLKGIAPVVVFTPDDLHLAKGPHSSRRSAIDDLGSQISKNFSAVHLDYEKLLRQKNKALKDELPDSYLSSIDEVMARVGAQLYLHRTVVFNRIKVYLNDYYHDITNANEQLSIQYRPSWNVMEGEYEREQIVELLFDSFEKSRDEDRRRGRTSIGPHADAVSFLLNGHDASDFASQGQQRSIVLAYKLTELQVLQNSLHIRPILLLDDVMSELDEVRRAAFLNYIDGNIQTFITTTNMEYFDTRMRSRAQIVELNGSCDVDVS